MKLITLILALAIGGCTQRIYQHDIVDLNGVSHTYYYQSNSIASDSSADSVTMTTKDGVVLKVIRGLQENDSIKGYTPTGIFETTK